MSTMSTNSKFIVISTIAIISTFAFAGMTAAYLNNTPSEQKISEPSLKQSNASTPRAYKPVREVPVQQNNTQLASNCTDGNIVGTVLGGVAGGVLGNNLGKGKGRTVATIGGALGGAYAGNKLIPTNGATCRM